MICTARRLRHGVLHLPQATLLDTAALSIRVPLKRYETVTAVTMLANAEMLVQMAMAARGATGPAPTLAGLAANIGGVGP